MKMLSEFNPKWIGQLRKDSGEGIELDCPVCGPTHRLIVYFKNPVDGQECASWNSMWNRIGEVFGLLTVEPSIQYSCFHGWIEEGKVFQLAESPFCVMADGKKVGLSPRQTEIFARDLLDKVEKVRQGI